VTTNQDDNFVAWVRGTKNVVKEEGGYLIPQKVKRAKPGVFAWVFRLFGNGRGWEWVNLQEEFIAKAYLFTLDDK
jgi:hypothetical protein